MTDWLTPGEWDNDDLLAAASYFLVSHQTKRRPPMNRIQIMEEAIRLTQGDRQEEYGSFLRNMQTWAALITTYLREKYQIEITLSSEDAAQFMVLNKIMRTMQEDASPKADTFIDEACYAAMAGEAAFAESEKPA